MAKLKELIEAVSVFQLDQRSEQVAGRPDTLISDERIIGYLKEAEEILCRKAWLIQDFTSDDCCSVQLTQDLADYDLHKSILHVLRARLSDSELDLVRAGYRDTRALTTVPYDVEYFDVNNAYTESSGRPTHFSTDFGVRVIQLRRKPDATAALLKLSLGVVRLPLVALSRDTLDKEPEIPEEHHRLLTDYAAGKILTSTVSVDLKMRQIGKDMLESFWAFVASAKRDLKVLQFSQPVFRGRGWANNNRARYGRR